MDQYRSDQEPLIKIAKRPNSERLIVDVPEEAFEFITKNREYLGQMLMELGRQCLKGNWPQNMVDAREYDHILPERDIIEHRTDVLSCSCRPSVDIVRKIVVHCPMDGRPSYFNRDPMGQHLWSVKHGKR